MVSKEKHPVLLQIYDYRQMFDAIFLEEALSDLYDAGCKDDNLSLLYSANKEIFMTVNSPHGQTEEQKNRVSKSWSYRVIHSAVYLPLFR